MEESIRIMKRMMLLLMAGLLAVCAAAAMAEEADADWTGEPIADATSAQEACAHEHTEPVYYFDAPEYLPLDGESHMVTGAAIVEVYCRDCGALVDVRQESNAQETRSHVFRNGVCALCGYDAAMFTEEEKAQEAAPADDAEDTADVWAYEETAEWTPAPVPESVLSLPAGEDPDQYTCTLTGMDLEEAGETLVLLPDGRNTAVVVKTDGELQC